MSVPLPSVIEVADLFAKHNVRPTVGSLAEVKSMDCGCAVTVLAMEYCGYKFSRLLACQCSHIGSSSVYDAVTDRFGYDAYLIASGFDGRKAPAREPYFNVSQRDIDAHTYGANIRSELLSRGVSFY